LKFAIELQAVYLRGTTYLRTPLFGIIPVVTLFVVCAGAVVKTILRTQAGTSFTTAWVAVMWRIPPPNSRRVRHFLAREN